MDHHSQSYQPLSHALQLPNNSTYTATNMNHKDSNNESPVEEEEEEGDDEGMVAQQLREQHQPDHEQERQDSRSPSPKPSQPQETPSASRRRGRPKGSRNRGGARAGTAAPQTGSGSAPPQLPEVTPQNQMYYEFQWRVLNLCSEFYGAAEELIKATQPLVIAQCYKMTSSPVDPMVMVNEAKRVCDTLLETPSKLISNPPPPMYPIAPTYYAPQAYMAPPPPVASTSGKPGQTAVISQPQSFALPIAPGVYAPGQYAPSYHYQYPGYPASAYYAVQSQQPQHHPPQQPQASPAPSGSNEAHIVSNPVAGVGSNQGTWSDEETERLKKLAQESKDAGLNGEPAWDWIVAQYGKTRTRHQILIRLTALGLKESSTRPSKRKRETEEDDSPRHTSGGAETTPPTNNTSGESPTLHPRPPGSASGSASWPMPAVASNTSPIVATANSQNTSYISSYRPRPSESPAPKPPSNNYYNQHMNGTSGSK